ncbi:DNA polymerase I, partial [bacterium]|nr:DNA polymerase I [bacterium]
MSKTTSKISLPKPSNTLYLIDISSFIFRAFYAIRSLQSKSGEPTNAVYGVATMLARLAEEAHPEYLAVVYDSKEPSFRKELYTEYKANRTSPPDDLIPQFGRIEEMIRAFEIHSYRQSGVEADDLIATLTHRWCKESEKNQVIIVSSDKDLMQLVNDRVQIWDTMTNKLYGVDQVVEKFGVGPHQIRDYLALVGDSSDNIPGVKGIGPKGAVDLLKEFGSLSHVLKAAHEGEVAGKKGETLKTHEKDARLSAELATVKDDLSVDIPLESLSYKFHVTKKLSELFHELSFQSLLARWSAQKGTESALISSDQEAGSALNQIALSHENRFKTILSREDLCSVIESIRKVGEFGFDLETTSLNPREAQIVGIALCYDSESSYYIPVGHRVAQVTQLSLKEVFQELKPVLEDPKIKKIGQNLKYDWSVLIEHGVKPQGIGADTMVAAYLLDPDDRHNLQVLASRYL